MSILKDKPFKKCHTDKRKMIDDIHTDIVSDLSGKELNNYYLDNAKKNSSIFSYEIILGSKSNFTTSA